MKGQKTTTISTASKSQKSKAISMGATKITASKSPTSKEMTTTTNASTSPKVKAKSKNTTTKSPKSNSKAISTTNVSQLPTRKRAATTDAPSLKVRKRLATQSPQSMEAVARSSYDTPSVPSRQTNRDESGNLDVPHHEAIPGNNDPVNDSLANYYVCCYTCGKTPCEWLEYGIDVLSAFKDHFDISPAQSAGYVVELGSGNEVSNNRIRFTRYRMFTYEKFGCLGKGNRIKLLDCVETEIKKTFPDLDGNNTNFSPNNEVAL